VIFKDNAELIYRDKNILLNQCSLRIYQPALLRENGQFNKVMDKILYFEIDQMWYFFFLYLYWMIRTIY